LYFASACGADVRAYLCKSAFQPQFEIEDALRMAGDLGVKIRVIEVDVMKRPEITSNPPDRCYYCKKLIFEAIAEAARADGYTLVLDGTNASDNSSDRPGMRALEELKVESPLRICGLTKSEIRSLSEKAGLFTWNKPAYACLATRIITGEEITSEKLCAAEDAEKFMFSLGFCDFRVRTFGKTAKIQVKKDQLMLVLEKREEIVRELKKYYGAVLLDLEARDEQ
ncbi:MAG: ATP-dependent sacrificial sulfur transferase LarE, partial [Firmicutes bacterium]|nr:ATP-dependent sacrificial sulfur transferase LarE [Bacillota bacterium]